MGVAASEGVPWVRSEPTSTRPKIGRLTLKQPTFDWGSVDKFVELRHCRLEVNNIAILQHKWYKKWAIIKNWPGRQSLKFKETLMLTEQEFCYTVDNFVYTLNNKFHPWHNEMIKSFQSCKLSRQNGENGGEWMERLRIAATECKYNKLDRE